MIKKDMVQSFIFKICFDYITTKYYYYCSKIIFSRKYNG